MEINNGKRNINKDIRNDVRHRSVAGRYIWIGCTVGILLLLGGIAVFLHRPAAEEVPELDPVEKFRQESPEWEKPGKYWETFRPTPNIYPEEANEVKGIVLHHTAYPGTAEKVVDALCNPKYPASCHVVIDTDGTRYVLAPPEAVTWHAGFSLWKDRYRANQFMVGIEFHGNTLEEPLTDAQIESSLEYMLPIIEKHGITREDIVTHEMIRDAYRKANPKNRKAWPKVDITFVEYHRVLNALDTARMAASRTTCSEG